MSPIVMMDGYRTDIRQDQYPSGRACVVASHPDLPGCVAYGKDDEEAKSRLASARQLYLGSLISTNEPVITVAETRTSVHWQMDVESTKPRLKIVSTKNASPALQTA